MPVYVDVNLGGGDGATYQTTKQPGRIAGEVTVWATSTGRIEYTFAADAIQYSDPAIVQSLGIDVIYEAIARETVIQGIARGYHPLTTSVATTKVYDPNSVAHEYRISYSQTTSAPVITEISEKVLAPQSTIQ